MVICSPVGELVMSPRRMRKSQPLKNSSVLPEHLWLNIILRQKSRKCLQMRTRAGF